MGKKQSKDIVDSRYLLPYGIYSKSEWDPRVLRKMVLTRKISPFYPPMETRAEGSDECPICMMCYFGGLNRSLCCGQSICSECFCQVKKPKTGYEATCPFCNFKPYNVVYRGPKTEEEQLRDQIEEQKVIELKMKMQKEQQEVERMRMRNKVETGASSSATARENKGSNSNSNNAIASHLGETNSSSSAILEEYQTQMKQYNELVQADELERARREKETAVEEDPMARDMITNIRQLRQEIREREEELDEGYIEEILRIRQLQKEEEEQFKQALKNSVIDTGQRQRNVQNEISNLSEFVPEEIVTQLSNQQGSNSNNVDLDELMLKRAIELSIEAQEAEKKEQEWIAQLQQSGFISLNDYNTVGSSHSNSHRNQSLIPSDDMLLIPNTSTSNSNILTSNMYNSNFRCTDTTSNEILSVRVELPELDKQQKQDFQSTFEDNFEISLTSDEASSTRTSSSKTTKPRNFPILSVENLIHEARYSQQNNVNNSSNTNTNSNSSKDDEFDSEELRLAIALSLEEAVQDESSKNDHTSVNLV